MKLHDINYESDESDESDEDTDYIQIIIDGAEEIGIVMTHGQVIAALDQVGLEADDISINQPVIDGQPCDPGEYLLYKGGSDHFGGWVTDDIELAKQYGDIIQQIVNYDGSSVSKWSIVHDWDGSPQLVPPGPKLRKVYDGGYIYLNDEEWKYET